MSEAHDSLLFFDRESDTRIVDRRLPHWSQAGVVTFITWRTCDSMPRSVLEHWRDECGNWLRGHGIDSAGDHQAWRKQLAKLPQSLRREYLNFEWNRWNDSLDACLGACELGRPELAKIVAECLHHLDGERYSLLDFVVMPNHLHLLAAFPSDDDMLRQCEAWKRFTSTRINKILSREGRFWQTDAFDHLVRSEEQFEYLRRYIASNPVKAKLNTGEYLQYSKDSPLSARTVRPRKASARPVEPPHSASAAYQFESPHSASADYPGTNP